MLAMPTMPNVPIPQETYSTIGISATTHGYPASAGTILHVSAILVRCDEYAVIGYSTMLGASIAYDERREQQRDRCVGVVCSASPVPASPASSPRSIF